MKKLLIAEASDVFASALTDALQHRFHLQLCKSGKQAMELLQTFQPDILLINLMLPEEDGLSVLQRSPFRPKIILATTPYVCRYLIQAVTELGVDFTMIAPSAKTLVYRLEDLVRTYSDTPDPRDLTAMTCHHLRLLNFSEHLDGYRQLCIALPLFVEDPQQLLGKELYPKVAAQFGCRDIRSVEHSVRKAIRSAWKCRDTSVWRKYFRPGPDGQILCPSNKQFICRLAEIVRTGSGVL